MPLNLQRQTLVETLFPDGIPRLWCPALSHFCADGSIDAARVACHLEAISPYAKGIMVPGSTGEGWDMNDAQVRDLLSVVMRSARSLGLRVLIGVMRKEVAQMLAVIEGTVSWLCEEMEQGSGLAAMLAANVVGFTVCPPCGRDLSTEQICSALTDVLELGHPTALYQLPQVTGNEMSPSCVASCSSDRCDCGPWPTVPDAGRGCRDHSRRSCATASCHRTCQVCSCARIDRVAAGLASV